VGALKRVDPQPKTTEETICDYKVKTKRSTLSAEERKAIAAAIAWALSKKSNI
jgi:hypothetical protein